MMMLATLGILAMVRSKADGGIALLGYFVLNPWIVSSWHCWWYAESYGQRSLIQSFPMMAFGLGTLFSLPKGVWGRAMVITLATMFIGLNVFQSWQFKEGIIDGARQTGPYYWAAFLNTGRNEESEHLKRVQRESWEPAVLGDESDYYHFEHGNYTMEAEHWDSRMERDTSIVKNGRYSAHLTTEYSDNHLLRFSDLTSGHYVWLRISAFVYPKMSATAHPFSLVAGTFHENSTYKYQAEDSEDLDLKLNEWNFITMDYLSPEMRFRDDKFKVFIWNRGGNDLYLDDFKVEVFVPRFDPLRE